MCRSLHSHGTEALVHIEKKKIDPFFGLSRGNGCACERGGRLADRWTRIPNIFDAVRCCHLHQMMPVMNDVAGASSSLTAQGSRHSVNQVNRSVSQSGRQAAGRVGDISCEVQRSPVDEAPRGPGASQVCPAYPLYWHCLGGANLDRPLADKAGTGSGWLARTRVPGGSPLTWAISARFGS